MRALYSSPRLENVERVAELLAEAGIATTISNGRSYKGQRRRAFSYREGAQEPATLWLVRPEDISRATAILREAGLFTSTRDRGYVPSAGRLHAPGSRPAPANLALRIRLVLLAVLLAMAMATLYRMA